MAGHGGVVVLGCNQVKAWSTDDSAVISEERYQADDEADKQGTAAVQTGNPEQEHPDRGYRSSRGSQMSVVVVDRGGRYGQSGVGVGGAAAAQRTERGDGRCGGGAAALRARASRAVIEGEATPGAKVRFWVIEAGAGAKVSREAAQEIKLVLNPRDTKAPLGPDGKPVP